MTMMRPGGGSFFFPNPRYPEALKKWKIYDSLESCCRAQGSLTFWDSKLFFGNSFCFFMIFHREIFLKVMKVMKVT